MAWPTQDQTLNDAYFSTNRTALQVDRQITSLRNLAASGDVERYRFIDAMRLLANSITTWTDASNVPGIGQYIQDQLSDPTLDVPAEFSAMVGAAEDLRDWIFAAFPTSGGAILNQAMDEDGKLTPLMFTQAQLTGFITEADALLATID